MPETTLEQWIDFVFDHAVTDPQWYWATDAPWLEVEPERTVELIAETFERSGELLARFSDAQLNQAFWFLCGCAGGEYMYELRKPQAPWPLRQRALRSFVPLFEQVMAVRCSPHLSHLDEQPANPLNSACYMWWDIIPLSGEPGDAARAAFDAEVLSVLQRLLAIPHDACRESALHGLGHWQYDYPVEVSGMIEEFLQRTPGLRPELARYAEAAKTGCVQ